MQNVTYDTYLIEPELKHVGGVFEKSKDAKIQLWVTADEHRIPVKIASKVAIGHFSQDCSHGFDRPSAILWVNWSPIKTTSIHFEKLLHGDTFNEFEL